MSSNKISRAKELNELLAKYDYEYFTNNHSLVTDDEYDKLWFELRSLLNDEEVKKALSKTDMSIGIQTSYLSKITHAKPVLSLDKEKIDDPEFQKKLKKFVETYETDGLWTISSKLDGLTIVEYKQNGFATFATRGGSTVGENVTHQFVRNQLLMKASDNIPDGMMIRGEGIIPLSSFEKILENTKNEIKSEYEKFVNDEHYHLLTISEDNQRFIDEYLDFNKSLSQEEISNKKNVISDITNSLKGYDSEFVRLGKSTISKLSKIFNSREKLYSNARNLASSSVRTNDTSVAVKNDVRFVVYDIMNSFNFNINTEIDVINKLNEYGFETVKQIVVTTEELYEFFKDDSRMVEWRENSEYEIDGLVIKPNEKIKNPKSNAHHEKGQLAIKFKSQGSYTTLRDVEWNLTSNGRYSPVAIFDEITVSGSTMSRASLNSWKSLQSLDLKIGDKIYVVRSNDVIPQVMSVDISCRTGKEIEINLPDNSELRGGIVYSTIKQELPLDKRIQKFMQRIGSKNIGLQIIRKLIKEEFVESISDMFLLSSHKSSLLKINGIGLQKIDQLLNEIESVKQNMTFENVIFALGIEGVGRKAVKEIIDVVPNVEYFTQITLYHIENAEELFGMTPSSQRGLRRLFDNPDDLLDLHDMGLIKE